MGLPYRTPPYMEGDTVDYEGQQYVSTIDNNTSTPGANSDWDLVREIATKWRGQWSSGSYQKHDVVIRDGLLMVANKATSGDPAPGHPDWDFLAWLPNQAVLRGVPTNNAPGTGFTAITGWDTATDFGVFNQTPPNPATGIITCPIASVLKVSSTIVLQQGNSNKELAYLFWIRGSTLGDSVWSIFDVATDKTTYRAVSGTFLLDVPAGETLQLGYSWQGDSSPGTSTFFPSSFEVKIELPVDFQS